MELSNSKKKSKLKKIICYKIKQKSKINTMDNQIFNNSSTISHNFMESQNKCTICENIFTKILNCESCEIMINLKNYLNNHMFIKHRKSSWVSHSNAVSTQSNIFSGTEINNSKKNTIMKKKNKNPKKNKKNTKKILKKK